MRDSLADMAEIKKSAESLRLGAFSYMSNVSVGCYYSGSVSLCLIKSFHHKVKSLQIVIKR